jgi:flagella basal body P-ring formation protein FlgA
MKSCGSAFRAAVLAAMLAASAVAAQASAPPAPPVPAALAARVGAVVAERWGVAPAAVRLEWPRVAAVPDLPDDAPLALLGAGRDGWYVVRATGPAGAVALRVRAGTADTVTVAARPIAAGARLAAADLRREPRPGWGPPRARTDETMVGWEARRALAEGETVARPAALPPLRIAPGQPVRVSWNRGPVSLALTGVALNGAREGGTVRVRVEGRTEPLTGVVSGPGTAVLSTGGER